MNFGSAKHYNSKSEAERDCEILKKIYPKLNYQIIGIDDLHITERVDFRPVNESKKVKTESAPADVIEYFGMQDNTDEEYKNNVAKEYKTLRAKYPDKEMILNGDFGTYLGTEKAEPIEKGEYITVYNKVEENKEDQPVEKVIADFKFGSNWRAVILQTKGEDEVKFYDLSASKNKFPQGEDMDNTYSITTLLSHKSDYIDNGATMYKDYTSRKFILSGEDMKDFFNKLDKIEDINYGKDFNTDDVDKYSAFDKKIRDLSRVKSNDKKYKQVVVTFGCDDCGHKEDWTFDDMFEWQLADLEASDSNNEVGDCPECGSMYYNMKDYKIIEESKKVTESKTSDMDTVDIIMELEGGELTIADVDDWNKVKEVANSLKGSQGYYGRLLRDMLESEKEFGGVENLPFPITM